LANGRLALSFLAVAFAGFALIYDYFYPFPQSKHVSGLGSRKEHGSIICKAKQNKLKELLQILAFCSISYFVMIFVLQTYQWYVEKLTFFQAVEQDKDTKNPPRYWKWSSDMKRFVYSF
jgi:hypothetical protein